MAVTGDGCTSKILRPLLGNSGAGYGRKSIFGVKKRLRSTARAKQVVAITFVVRIPDKVKALICY